MRILFALLACLLFGCSGRTVDIPSAEYRQDDSGIGATIVEPCEFSITQTDESGVVTGRLWYALHEFQGLTEPQLTEVKASLDGQEAVPVLQGNKVLVACQDPGQSVVYQLGRYHV